MDHKIYMRRCFELALCGIGKVAPNPLVGAVLVHHGQIVSEGYHHFFGGPHAEVNCINDIRDPSLLKDATLYVNLEPCSHHGKTPPCADLIIKSGIKHVVVCNQDPNPLVAGRGLERLRQAGIRVETDVLTSEGCHLNKRFFTFHQYKRPYLILKWAQSYDGFIAPVNTQTGITWISNKLSRNLVHQWRAEEQAILVGRKTVENDNPLLTVRGLIGTNPVRIIIDPQLKLHAKYRVFNNTARVILVNTIENSMVKNVTKIKVSAGKRFLSGLVNSLYEQNIQSVLIEGGAETINSFISLNQWDEARVFTGSAVLGDGIKAPFLSQSPDQCMNVNGDLLEIYTNKSSR